MLVIVKFSVYVVYIAFSIYEYILHIKKLLRVNLEITSDIVIFKLYTKYQYYNIESDEISF